MTIEKLGRYEILGELGKGAMGQVFLARDPLIGRELALKTFRVGLSAQDQELEQFRVRFLREAQSAGILNHPNIVTIHDVVVEQGGDFFIAMEYVKGEDLKHLIQRQGRLDLRFVLDVIAQIADGLDYAHGKGVVHRDIKPANIILTKEKQAKITDFGIARVDASNLTTEGQLLGTPNYMSPEQIQGQPVDHRADLWALGVMLYEMVTGKKPFLGENLTQVTHKIVFDPFPDPKKAVPNLPGNLEKILAQALGKKPDDRYQKGSDLARDLRAVFNRPTTSAIGSSGSFLGGEGDPATGTLTVQNPAANLTITSAAAHEALKPPTGTVPTLRSTATGVFPVQPPPSEAKGSKTAWIAAGAAGLAVVVLLVVIALKGGNGTPPPGDGGPRADPEAALQASYMPHIDEARRLLDAGDPDAALVAVEKALAVVPENREVRQLRHQAEEMRDRLAGDDSQSAVLLYRLEQVRAALAARDYRLAARQAEAVLELDPKNDEGQKLLAEAQDGLLRREQVRDRLSASGSGPSPVTTTDPASNPTVAPPPATAAAPEPTTLEIDFFSELSEGRLTIYHGSNRLYQDSFKFEEGGSGVFQRSKATSGRLTQTVTLPAGPVKLSIYTKPKGADTRITDVEGVLAPGGNAVLHLRLTQDTRVQASIE